MLGRDWNSRKSRYDFVVIGSGYGGAITASRLVTSDLNPKPTVCLLERGKEWPVGTFPDTLEGYLAQTRSSANPLGLYELLNYPHISVLKGSGLGGTSLVNANVAIEPDEDTFTRAGWPAALKYPDLQQYYRMARVMLAAKPHPDHMGLPKVQALARRAQQAGLDVQALNIAVNFDLDNQPNAQGVPQKKCTDCGDCVSGCNVGAKNTLYMNYLPMAAANGAEIFTQTKVEWIEKLPAGGWKVHGVYVKSPTSSQKFEIEAGNVVLSAGSINSTEILLRSANLHGLSVSHTCGTRFGGNGDFFGISYNGNNNTSVLGFGNHANPGTKAPGPSIVAIVRYPGTRDQRFAVEDLSFASAYVRGAQLAFAALPGEDTDAGDEFAELTRRANDVAQDRPYRPDGALNHSMLYLCMGSDDQGGYFQWERPLFERDGRVTVMWPNAGRQPVFGAINEELRRHARREGGSFMENPIWSMLQLRRLITAHPLGGCPMGDDAMSGTVDQWGRVFAADGSVHDGLFVIDGAIIPTALGVNPFLTISAVAERAVARKIEAIGGNPYPAASVSVSFANLDAREMIRRGEAELDRIFERTPCQSIELMVNEGGRQIDRDNRTVRNDEYWKGFFPSGNVLNEMSAALYTGFKKKFSKKGSKYIGLTSDTDGVINARNSLEEIELKQPKGDLPAGKYILLKYVDPPWQGFYDVFKVVNKDLLLGRVYLGEYPNGQRMFTFPMTRVYGFDNITVEDHRILYAQGTVPTAPELEGAWRMDTISNANHGVGVAHLEFHNQPDGRLESHFQLMGLIEGMIVPTFTQDHFQLNDFTPFCDEIRKLDDGFFIGKWVMDLPASLDANSLPVSLGIFHREPGTTRFGFYYLLTRVSAKLPTNPLLSPLLDRQLPRGIGMTFDEEMEGWYFPGHFTPAAGRAGDLTIGDRIPDNAPPAGAPQVSFKVRMIAVDLNDFIDGAEHEARMEGSIRFSQFASITNATFPIDRQRSYFNYLRVNPETREAEMRYHIEFTSNDGKRFLLEGRKYMQKDEAIGVRGPQEVMDDYTTLYTHIYELTGAGSTELGTAYLKFRTFEDLRAVGNLTGFVAGFRVTGTTDIGMQTMARLRFLAFTAQFVQHEYDPLAMPVGAGG
ncbi:MAG: GMC family oxidoreductase [Acidobacteria bacterium]|nr:GMC family oxidoreductase [Acidobacteriota bacterium]